MEGVLHVCHWFLKILAEASADLALAVGSYAVLSQKCLLFQFDPTILETLLFTLLEIVDYDGSKLVALVPCTKHSFVTILECGGCSLGNTLYCSAVCFQVFLGFQPLQQILLEIIVYEACTTH
jgi:hypothetical protein